MAVGTAVNHRGTDARWFALPVALLAPLLGVAAVISPVGAVAGATALLFVTVAFYDLAAGVALFATLTFLEALPGVGGGLGAVKVGGFVLVLAALRRSGAPFLLKEHPALAYVASFFVGWAVASSLWAEDVARAGGGGLRLVLNVALVFVVVAAVRDAHDARWIVWGYLAGGAAAAGVGFLVPAEDGSNRLVGGLGEPNFLAAVLIPALVFAVFALGWTERGAAQRWLLWGCVLLFTVAIFLTQSRGGLVALAITFVAALLFGGRMRRHFALFGALAAASDSRITVRLRPRRRSRGSRTRAGGQVEPICGRSQLASSQTTRSWASAQGTFRSSRRNMRQRRSTSPLRTSSSTRRRWRTTPTWESSPTSASWAYWRS